MADQTRRLAELDQAVASVDGHVRRHVARVRLLIAEHGKEVAVATIQAWLQNQPAEEVADVAAGALARLALSEEFDVFR